MNYNFDKLIDRRNTNTIKYGMLKKRFGTTDLLPMWVADMEFETPDFIIDGVKKRLEHPVLGYSLKPQAYYEAIQKWQQKRNNWRIKKDWIMPASGVVPSLGLLIQVLTRPGDKIVIQPPVYFPFQSTIKNNGRQVVSNPLRIKNGRYEFDFEDLRKKIDSRTKAFIFCNPHNPVGRVWTEDELRQLAEICIEKDLIIISDEIHSDLIHPGHKHLPIASLSKEISMHTLTTFAPTKTFNAAGILSSVIVAENPKLRRAYGEIVDDLHLFIDNVMGTAAFIAAYENGEGWLKQLMIYIHDNYLFAKEFIENKMPNVGIFETEGTYLMWLDYRKIFDNEDDLQNYFLKKAKLAPDFGAWFGSEGNGFARLNLAAPRSFVQNALDRMLEAYPN